MKLASVVPVRLRSIHTVIGSAIWISTSAACGIGDGFVDADDDASASGGAAGGSEGGPDLVGPHGPGVPPGFVGPVTLQFGEGAACSGAFNAAIASGYEGLAAGPAVCAPCSCQMAGCDASVTVTRTSDDDAPACSGCMSTLSLEPGSCVNLKGGQGCGNGGPGHHDYSVTSVTLTPATCTASAPQPAIPPITWASQAVVCAPSTSSDLGPSLCIAATGERTCPAPFSKRRILYASFTDTRGCSSCTCSVAACTGAVELYHDKCDDEHVTGLLDAPIASTCAFVSDDKPKARFVLNPSSMQCQAVGSQPVGQATATEPTTVCCRE